MGNSASLPSLESSGRPFGTERSPLLSLKRHAERQTETRGPVERLDRAVEAGGRRRARKIEQNGGRRGSRGDRPEELRAERQSDGTPSRRRLEAEGRAEAQARRGRSAGSSGTGEAATPDAGEGSFGAHLAARTTEPAGRAPESAARSLPEQEATAPNHVPAAPVTTAPLAAQGALGLRSGVAGLEGAAATTPTAGARPASPAAAQPAGLPRSEAPAPRAATKPTTAPAQPTEASEAQEAQRASQVLQQLRMHLHPGLRSATVQLHPAELGRLSIRVSVDQGGVLASVRAESEEALAVLERHLPELEAAFADQGFEEMSFEFVLDQHASPDGEAWTQGQDVSHELQQLVEEQLGPQITNPSATQDVGVDTYA